MDAFFVARIKVVIVSVVAVFFLISTAQAEDCRLSAADLHAAQKVSVSEVIDGDTIRLASGKLVRFIGINTPEIDHKLGNSQAFAEKARDRLKTLIAGFNNSVVLRFGSQRTDRYGRQLAHVFTLDGENIEADLLDEGLGVWIVVPPNLDFMACYQAGEKRARDAKAGVWAEQFRQPVDTRLLRNNDTGFQWIQGKIVRIGKGRANWWLNFEDVSPQLKQKHSRVTLRVHKDDLHYFEGQLLENLLNKEVRVKGWVSHYKEQLVMSLRHPASLEIVSQ